MFLSYHGNAPLVGIYGSKWISATFLHLFILIFRIAHRKVDNGYTLTKIIGKFGEKDFVEIAKYSPILTKIFSF